MAVTWHVVWPDWGNIEKRDPVLLLEADISASGEPYNLLRPVLGDRKPEPVGIRVEFLRGRRNTDGRVIKVPDFAIGMTHRGQPPPHIWDPFTPFGYCGAPTLRHHIVKRAEQVREIKHVLERQ